MKVERSVRSGTDLAPLGDALQRLFLRGRTLHALEHVGRGVLERDVEIGQHLALGHQRNDVVDVRVGVDVMQPHPDAEFAQRLRQVDELRADFLVAPFAGSIFDVEPIGRGVLRDHQQFLDAGGDQFLGLAQHVGGRARHQIAAQARDDAERAAVVAAFGNLQIGVVPRRQLDAFRRHQIEERIVLRRHRAMHGIDHALILLRAGDRQHLRVGGRDALRLRAHAAGDDDLAVFLQRAADGRKRLRFGAVEKAAGVDDDEIGAGVLARELVALRAQPRDDALAVHQRLRAAERNEAHLGGGGFIVRIKHAGMELTANAHEAQGRRCYPFRQASASS